MKRQDPTDSLGDLLRPSEHFASNLSKPKNSAANNTSSNSTSSNSTSSEEASEFRDGNFCLSGRRFHSRSEAACAIIMELFIPGFTVSPGLNFQILIGKDQYGNQLSVDFMINDILFEYHPPRFSRSQRNSKKKQNIRVKKFSGNTKHKRSQKSSPDDKGQFRQHSFQYYRKRRKQIDRNPEFRGRQLIVATSPEEFYEKVLSEFGRHPLPGKEEFLELFRVLQSEVRYVSCPAPSKKKRCLPKKQQRQKLSASFKESSDSQGSYSR